MRYLVKIEQGSRRDWSGTTFYICLFREIPRDGSFWDPITRNHVSLRPQLPSLEKQRTHTSSRPHQPSFCHTRPRPALTISASPAPEIHPCSWLCGTSLLWRFSPLCCLRGSCEAHPASPWHTHLLEDLHFRFPRPVFDCIHKREL